MHKTGNVYCLANSYTEYEAYRESVGHLLLPVNRFEEFQVADYSRWGQAEYGSVVIQGNRHHGVFRLPTERHTERSMLPWQSQCFIFFIFFYFQAAAVGLRKPIKQYILICQRVEKVICWQDSPLSLEISGKAAEDEIRNQRKEITFAKTDLKTHYWPRTFPQKYI